LARPQPTWTHLDIPARRPGVSQQRLSAVGL